MSHHFRLIGSETQELTPELAAEFSQMPASVTERDLDKKRMAYLKAHVLDGSAISFIWAKAKIADTGEVFRVNGHHSATMLASLNGNFPGGLKAHIDEYEVPSLAELAYLFRQFDSRRSARSLDDISGAYQGLQVDLRDVPKKAARKAVEGIAWYSNRVIGAYVPKGEDSFDLFNRQDLHPFITLVGKIYSKKTPEFSASVFGAMFGTWEKDPERCESFWDNVAMQGAGNEDKHPTTVLDAWLLAAHELKDKPKPKEWEIYRACVLCWNAFRNGRSIERITRFDPKKGVPDLE